MKLTQLSGALLPILCQKKGKVRLVIDYRRLNEATSRPVHPFSNVRDLMREIQPSVRIFAKVDAVHGYFQVLLSTKASKMCTFLLPDGKYHPLVAPMGWHGSGDHFSQRTDEAVAPLTAQGWLSKIIDDMLVQGTTEDELLDRLQELFNVCYNAGITLSIDKLEVEKSVSFAGFIVSRNGLRPDPAKVAAIKAFPTPTNITGLRSFMGLANQLGYFLPDLAQATHKMRELLKKRSAWLWLSEHQEEFERAKTI